jgi:hypothetical protein
LGESVIVRMLATRTLEHTVMFGSLLRLDANDPHTMAASPEYVRIGQQAESYT